MIIKIKGGLGNQMFQYAYGRNQELAGKKVVFDTSFFSGNKAKIDTARDFKLNNFNIRTKAEFSDKKHPFLDIYIKIMKLNPYLMVFIAAYLNHFIKKEITFASSDGTMTP